MILKDKLSLPFDQDASYNGKLEIEDILTHTKYS